MHVPYPARPSPRPPRTRFLTWVAAFAVVATAVGAYVDVDRVFPRLGVRHDPQAWFEEHRAGFEEAASWARGRCCVDQLSGVTLPVHLRHLSDDEKVYVGEGRVFFPQWFGIPDDAGGFWHSADGEPGPMESFGTPCTVPERLGDGWSSCGLVFQP